MSKKFFKKFSWFQNQRKVQSLPVPALLLFIPLLFFYKTIIFQQIPFPGDLLVGNYEPYKSDSGIGVVPHKGQGADVIRELYPWKYFVIEELKSGIFPLWNPYTFSGNPHFAALQSGVLYPVNILFFILPFVPAWSIYIILQFIFLSVFTYLFLREIKLSRLASILGSVSFSFSGFIAVWAWYGNLGHTLSFLPLTFLFIEKAINRPKWYWYLALILSLTLSIFAGYIQFTIYIILLAVFYIAARFFFTGKKDIRTYILLLLCFPAAVLLGAVQLFPTFELVSLSLRSTYSYNVLLERLMPPESVITLLVPDFFGNPATMNYFLRGGSSLERASSIGLWPLIFAVFALFSKKTFARNFFLASVLVIYLSVLSLPPIAYFHSIGIPFLSTGVPTRALSIFCFCLAVLSAIGFDSFLKNPLQKKTILKVMAFTSIIFVSLWAITFLIKDPHLLVSRRNLILPSILFFAGAVALFLPVKKKYSVTILLLLTVFELFYYFQKFNSFVPEKYVFPRSTITKELRQIQGIDRFWGYGSGNIDANFQLIEKNYTTAGYDALFSKRYGEFTSASKDGKIPPEVPRSVADILGGYGVNDLKNNTFRKRALDITGVKYILNKNENKGIDSAFDQKYFQLIWENNGWQIYDNKNQLPRIVLFGYYKAISDKNKIIETLYQQTFDPNKTVILEKSLSGVDILPDKNATVKVALYSPNEIQIKTQSKTDQILFISDNYFPGWHAYVDGLETPIYRANYTFRGVVVKSGEHVIKMVYFPDSFKWGIIVSTLSLGGLILAVLFVTITKRTSK